MKKILLIEDEAPIARLLQAYLAREPYEVRWDAGDGDLEGLFLSWRPDLVLLDLTLPDQDGMEILKQLRQYGSCPVIIVTARGAVPDRLRGLQEGADDYIPKPFDPEEVVARVQAVLRRSTYMADHEAVRLGSLVIDFTSCAVYLNEQAVPLIPRDWNVLAFLARRPNQCFSREQLLDSIWGIDYEGGDRAVDTTIKRLRQCLKDWPESEGAIRTLRGMGYSLHVR
ncbi:response regulator transcription factor [Paenibacillus dendritiformis]|uniref:response regulator transcription factor n=1 Tax=Paenibacillus dendritiformis TaxID=130049 RepID=UPI00248C620E|nr:response regulator transcription factor [Paenibacillus dendritiformis]WGU94406.1 response regulator transcription factor [Paenibacillus dendritiformis]